jgi:hypothetical protein
MVDKKAILAAQFCSSAAKGMVAEPHAPRRGVAAKRPGGFATTLWRHLFLSPTTISSREARLYTLTGSKEYNAVKNE